MPSELASCILAARRAHGKKKPRSLTHRTTLWFLLTMHFVLGFIVAACCTLCPGLVPRRRVWAPVLPGVWAPVFGQLADSRFAKHHSAFARDFDFLHSLHSQVAVAYRVYGALESLQPHSANTFVTVVAEPTWRTFW